MDEFVFIAAGKFTEFLHVCRDFPVVRRGVVDFTTVLRIGYHYVVVVPEFPLIRRVFHGIPGNLPVNFKQGVHVNGPAFHVGDPADGAIAVDDHLLGVIPGPAFLPQHLLGGFPGGGRTLQLAGGDGLFHEGVDDIPPAIRSTDPARPTFQITGSPGVQQVQPAQGFIGLHVLEVPFPEFDVSCLHRPAAFDHSPEFFRLHRQFPAAQLLPVQVIPVIFCNNLLYPGINKQRIRIRILLNHRPHIRGLLRNLHNYQSVSFW